MPDCEMQSLAACAATFPAAILFDGLPTVAPLLRLRQIAALTRSTTRPWQMSREQGERIENF